MPLFFLLLFSGKNDYFCPVIFCQLKNLIKSGREKKGLLIREVANLIGVDAALVSKFESGTRKPTRLQIHKLAQILDLDADELMVAWLKEKILFEVGTDDFALRAMIAA